MREKKHKIYMFYICMVFSSICIMILVLEKWYIYIMLGNASVIIFYKKSIIRNHYLTIVGIWNILICLCLCIRFFSSYNKLHFIVFVIYSPILFSINILGLMFAREFLNKYSFRKGEKQWKI